MPDPDNPAVDPAPMPAPPDVPAVEPPPVELIGPEEAVARFAGLRDLINRHVQLLNAWEPAHVGQAQAGARQIRDEFTFLHGQMLAFATPGPTNTPAYDSDRGWPKDPGPDRRKPTATDPTVPWPPTGYEPDPNDPLQIRPIQRQPGEVSTGAGGKPEWKEPAYTPYEPELPADSEPASAPSPEVVPDKPEPHSRRKPKGST